MRELFDIKVCIDGVIYHLEDMYKRHMILSNNLEGKAYYIAGVEGGVTGNSIKSVQLSSENSNLCVLRETKKIIDERAQCQAEETLISLISLQAEAIRDKKALKIKNTNSLGYFREELEMVVALDVFNRIKEHYLLAEKKLLQYGNSGNILGLDSWRQILEEFAGIGDILKERERVYKSDL